MKNAILVASLSILTSVFGLQSARAADGPVLTVTGIGVNTETAEGDALIKISAACKALGYNSYYEMGAIGNSDGTELRVSATCVNQ